MFWFLIKNIIPRGQGRNQADAMHQCLTNLMDQGEQINLPALMIKHIARISNTTRAHDLGYGFLLTRMFEHFRVELQRKVDAQVIDEVGSSIIMGCGFDLIHEGDLSSEQQVQTPTSPVPRSSSSQPPVAVLQQEQQRLQDEITAMKVFFRRRRNSMPNIMRTSWPYLLLSQPSSPLLLLRSPPPHLFLPYCILFPSCFCYPMMTPRTLVT